MLLPSHHHHDDVCHHRVDYDHHRVSYYYSSFVSSCPSFDLFYHLYDTSSFDLYDVDLLNVSYGGAFSSFFDPFVI